MGEKDVLIFRSEMGISDGQLKKLRNDIADQLAQGNVVVLPQYVSLLDIREKDDGSHEIGYI